MTQKQIVYRGWKTRRFKTGEYERKAALPGYDDFNRMAMDNSRASRLIAQIVNQFDEYPQNEFGSYYYSSGYNHPKYSVTSNATYSPGCKKRTTTCCPSTVGFRWKSNVETPSVENTQINVTNDHTFKCKCDNCRMKYCRFKSPSTSTLKPFKDNIMTFSDKETMTPMLRDAFCATSFSPTTPKMSDVSVTTSCTRDKEFRNAGYGSDCEPISILKKQSGYKCKPCNYRNEKSLDSIHQPERDLENNREYMKPKLIKSIFKRRKEKHIEVETPKKTLYNEGINDVAASRFLLTAIKPPPVNLISDSSRVSIPSMCIPSRLYIPFSHKGQSRYHTTCKKSLSTFKCEDNDELKHFIASPEVIRRYYPNKAVKHSKMPNIKLPKRVLTSERDIESYVRKKNQSHSSKEKK